MKKFDFFNQYRDPVIVVKSDGDVAFKNNMFCRVFSKFENIKRFAHKMNFEMCPIDSENIAPYRNKYFHTTMAQDSLTNLDIDIDYENYDVIASGGDITIVIADGDTDGIAIVIAHDNSFHRVAVFQFPQIFNSSVF